jgi:hypothetical protein
MGVTRWEFVGALLPVMAGSDYGKMNTVQRPPDTVYTSRAITTLSSSSHPHPTKRGPCPDLQKITWAYG